jgi:hypothetical protein
MRLTRIIAMPLALAAIASIAEGALPPNAQRVREFTAILQDEAVTGAFPVTRPIERIEHVGPDRYRVSGGGCHIDVAIVGLPMPRGMIGARRFDVRAGARTCATDQ